MLKLLLNALFLASVFSACSSYTPIYKSDQKDIEIKIAKGNYYKVPSNEKAKRYLQSCVLDSHYLKDTNDKYDFALDYIDLKHNCEWDGFSKSGYTLHLTNANKITSLQVLDKYENDDIDITRYKSDKGCDFYLIGIYALNDVIFIVDKKGTMAMDIVKSLGIDMDIKIEKTCSKEILKLEDSIIKNNFFFKYFKRIQRDRDEPILILPSK